MTLLQNPKNIQCDFDKLSEKLTIANTLLSQSPKKGGQPFVYAFCAGKKHILEDKRTLIPHVLVEEKKIVYFKTALTDGKAIYYHPRFLEKLDPFQLAIVIAHEAFHMALQHCNINRVSNLNPKVWNIAVDFAANSIIEKEFIDHNFINKYSTQKDKHPIWNGALHKPCTLQKLIDQIREANKNDDSKSEEEKGKLDISQFEEDLEWEADDEELYGYADVSQYGRSPEEIYNEIMTEVHKDGNDGQSALDAISDSMDVHEPYEIDKNKILSDILNAATSARRLNAGSSPSAINDMIGELEEPKMKWQDICNTTFNKKRVDNGKLNNWSRIRRRSVSTGIYMPKFCDYKIKWLAALDTSGSMSTEDMTFGVSQLKGLDPRCEGTLVCWDAEVYWDHAKNIRSVSDLSNAKVVGRGGTVLNSFFTDYKQKLSRNGPFDLIIVITDGYLFDFDLKKPDVDVVWVITSGIKDFNPPFGKVSSLRSF
jgi:predicted metal-dependent peptidase